MLPDEPKVARSPMMLASKSTVPELSRGLGSIPDWIRLRRLQSTRHLGYLPMEKGRRSQAVRWRRSTTRSIVASLCLRNRKCEWSWPPAWQWRFSRTRGWKRRPFSPRPWHEPRRQSLERNCPGLDRWNEWPGLPPNPSSGNATVLWPDPQTCPPGRWPRDSGANLEESAPPELDGNELLRWVCVRAPDRKLRTQEERYPRAEPWAPRPSNSNRFVN